MAAVSAGLSDSPLASHRVSPWTRLALVAALAALGCAALPLDLPIARWFHNGRCPGELLRFLSFAETFAHGYGVSCILITVLVLDSRRWQLPRAVALSLGAGAMANVVKLLVERTRPHEFNLSGGGSVLATFGQWLPMHHVPSGEQSFPSAHMATAVGLAAALAWLYPRGRYWFAALALLAGLQRMSSLAHYLSDVVWGAATGTFALSLFLPGGVLSGLFDRLERRFGAPGNDKSLDLNARPTERLAA